MDIEKRTWMTKSNTGEIKGPYPENKFQKKLRAGEIPYFYFLKSNEMNDWQPLLEVVSNDATFRRPSSIPPTTEDS